VAEALDPRETVDFKELLIANMIKIQTTYTLLVDKGIITAQEYFGKLAQVRDQYRVRH